MKEKVNLGEEHLTMRLGILRIHEATVPFSKITNVSYHQGLWGNLMGYGSVVIDTAGSDKPEMVLRGYPEALRDAILKKIG